MICACGCGQEFEPSRSTLWRLNTGRISQVFIHGHNGRGEGNGRWKSGKTLSSHGYVMVKMPDHPNAAENGYVLEHRLVMSNHLGRALTDQEVVHHRNGDITDNRIENLELHTAATHRALHDPRERQRVVREPKICPVCGKTFTKTLIGNHRRAKVCSKACRNASGALAPRRILSLEDEAAIRTSSEPRKALAARYGVSEAAIKRVRRANR